MAPKTAPTKTAVSTEPSTDAQAVAAKNLLAKFAALSLPELATGGELANYQQDLISVGRVQAQKGNNPKLLIYSKDEKEIVAKIHPAQQRALLFIVMSFLASPRTDRGFAYTTWAAANRELLETVLGEYKVEVDLPKSTLPKIVGTVSDLLSAVVVRAKIVHDSVAMQAPVKSIGTRHAATESEYELIL